MLYMEGTTDIEYLTAAARSLEKTDVLDNFELVDGGGEGKLSNIWKNRLAFQQIANNKIILLYDCDTNKETTEDGAVYKRVIPKIEAGPIEVGIENLFPVETIAKVERQNACFIDVTEATTMRSRGKEITLPRIKSVNENEKKNMCEWLCENGDRNDFANFEVVFKLLEDLI